MAHPAMIDSFSSLHMRDALGHPPRACRCNVTGEFGWSCAECDGDNPSFCRKCEDIQADVVGFLGFGLYATEEGLCAKCMLPNCTACPDGTCTQCMYNFGLFNGSCQPCAQETCANCKGSPTNCTECGWGHYIEETTGECLPVRESGSLHAVNSLLHHAMDPNHPLLEPSTVWPCCCSASRVTASGAAPQESAARSAWADI